MTDRELHDLLRDRVADVGMPDLSGAAWERARTIRRRRGAGLVAGAVASVAVVAVALAGLPGGDRSSGPAPAPSSPAPTTRPAAPAWPAGWPGGARGTRPDGRYRGWSVYWGPLADQEGTLPAVASPLPRTIDLSAPAPDLASDPVRSALAAFALTDESGVRRVLLLAPDGSLRSVDVSRVAPYDDGTGRDVSVARPTLLSPTGRYLAFPQQGRVLVLTLATARWRSIETGRAPTAGVQWMGDTDLWLPRTPQGGDGPMYSLATGRRSGGANPAAPRGPLDDGATPSGRWRMGPGGDAQGWSGVTGVPLPPHAIRPAQVLVARVDAPLGHALLVLGAASLAQDRTRPVDCCGVQFWLDGSTVVYESTGSGGRPERLVAWRVGSHDLGLVATIEGYDADREGLVASYVRIWDR